MFGEGRELRVSGVGGKFGESAEGGGRWGSSADW